VGGRFPNLWTRISSIYTALGTGRMQSGCTDESNWPAPKLSLPTKRGEIYGSRLGFKLKSKTESQSRAKDAIGRWSLRLWSRIGRAWSQRCLDQPKVL